MYFKKWIECTVLFCVIWVSYRIKILARSLNNFHFHFYPSSHLLKIISFDDAPLLHPTIDCHSLSLALFVALLFHLNKWHPNLILSFQKIYITYYIKLFWHKWCSPSLVVMGGDSDTIERFWARMQVPNNIIFFKNVHTRSLFVLFSSFQLNTTIFTTNICEKVHPVYGAGIWIHNLQNMSILA